MYTLCFVSGAQISFQSLWRWKGSWRAGGWYSKKEKKKLKKKKNNKSVDDDICGVNSEVTDSTKISIFISLWKSKEMKLSRLTKEREKKGGEKEGVVVKVV